MFESSLGLPCSTDPWIVPPGQCTSMNIGSYSVDCSTPNETASVRDTTNPASATKIITDDDARAFGKYTAACLLIGFVILYGLVVTIASTLLSFKLYHQRSETACLPITALFRGLHAAAAFFELVEVDLRPGMLRVRYSCVHTVIMS